MSFSPGAVLAAFSLLVAAIEALQLPSAQFAQPAAAPARRPRAPPPTADALADGAYTVGVLAVLTLVGRSVFDSVFIENDSTTPGKPKLSFPMPGLFGGASAEDPTLEAERIRIRMQAAAQAGDLELAFRLEKELKQFLWDNNVVYEVDIKPVRQGLRIEDIAESQSGSVMGSENSAERDQLLRDLE